jgi:hypothetical protein
MEEVGVMGEVEGMLSLALDAGRLRAVAAMPVAAETLAMDRTTWSGSRCLTTSKSAIQAGMLAKPVSST